MSNAKISCLTKPATAYGGVPPTAAKGAGKVNWIVLLDK